jgi:CDP-diacylglycerol--glycerol-3-phosphate 3-phosphatidyltransferase
MLRHLPNALTGLRILLAPVAAWLLILEGPALTAALAGGPPAVEGGGAMALLIFAVAAGSDLLDGMAARLLNAGSRLGRILDPIADKVLVALPLIAASHVVISADWPYGMLIAAVTIVIITRDSLITWLRLSAADGEGVPVSRLAKWKTAVELGAIACLFASPALPPGAAGAPVAENLSAWGAGCLILLTLSALLSLQTGAQYLRPSR